MDPKLKKIDNPIDNKTKKIDNTRDNTTHKIIDNKKLTRKDFLFHLHKKKAQDIRMSPVGKILSNKLQSIANILDPRGLDYYYNKKQNQDKTQDL